MAKRERRIIQRLERCHTLKHRSWLNIAENKLRSINYQCIKRRRFGTIRQLREETMAWYHCNTRHRIIEWQMSMGNARIKLKLILPKFIEWLGTSSLRL